MEEPTKRTKVLFLIDNLRGGGAEKVMTDIVNHLDASRYEVTVKTLVDDGVYRQSLRPHVRYHGGVRPGHLRESLLWRAIRRLPRRWTYKYFVRERYDVEIAFLEGLSTRVMSGSTSAARKIAWVHNDMDTHYYVSAYFRSLDEHRACYRVFDSIVCVSQTGADGFIRRMGEFDSLRIINNLIDVEQIREKGAAELPEEAYADLDAGVPILCSVGRLTEVKGYLRLLSCHKRLLEEGLRHVLWLVGDGSMRTELEGFIAENGLGDSVRLWGFRDNPYPFVQHADLYVSSSFAEGYPLSVAEALVLERPVVGTHCAGTDEILGGGQYGLITENSEDGICEGLRAVLGSREEFERLREKAGQGACQFQVDRILSQIEELF